MCLPCFAGRNRFPRARGVLPESFSGLPSFRLAHREMVVEIGREINRAPVDLAFVGIGENGHLAFNDPPADFETEEPYLVVNLDQACRAQQVGEGWFASIEEVPQQAITISIPQLLKAREILCIVPGRRKAKAVQACLEGPLSTAAPTAALRVHPNTTIFLDADSASLLRVSRGSRFDSRSIAAAMASRRLRILRCSRNMAAAHRQAAIRRVSGRAM